MDRFSLKGKTALVTGAGQGIGRALAHGLADAGADVAVVDLDLDLARSVSDEITTRNPDVRSMAINTDVTNPEQVNSMVDQIVKTWGKLTIACNLKFYFKKKKTFKVIKISTMRYYFKS